MFRPLVSVIITAASMALLTGCAMQPGVPSEVDLQAAKDANMPVVIYDLEVSAPTETGMVKPGIFFVNSSDANIYLVHFLIKPVSSEGGKQSPTLWQDAYKTVSPGKSNGGFWGSGWKNEDIVCIQLEKAEIEMGNGQILKYDKNTLGQLFQDPSVNNCGATE
jgi:hypothetical protein